MAYTVTCALVVAKDPGGKDWYGYEGALVPVLAAGEVERLAEGGYIAKGEEPAKDAPAAESGADQPAGNASLEEWQEFARSQGATDAYLEGKLRNDLRDEFGK